MADVRSKLPPAKRIGIVANFDKEGAERVLVETAQWINDRGGTVVVDQDLACELPVPVDRVSLSEMGASTDVVVSIGGDGTLIATARAVGDRGTPVLGVNLGGKLGFLTELNASEMPGAMEGIMKGGLPVDERMNLSVEINRGGKPAYGLWALNDCVLNRDALSGILEFTVSIDDESLGTFLADGVVVSTPTGSTAYSLSAGGPVLHPRTRALVLTPLCPHTLSVRPVVLAEDQTVSIRVGADKGSARLTVDGHTGIDLQHGDQVRVAKTSRTTRLVSCGRSSFYSLLREKFEWGGTPHPRPSGPRD